MDRKSRLAASLAETKPLAEEPHRSPSVALPPDMLDHPRYEVLEFLGAGGMGVVYKAQHRYMDRPVALKFINDSLLNHPGVVRRFHEEVRAAARLTHPNIVHAYDADEWRGAHFLVMEFVEGADLDRILVEHDRLGVSEACRYIRQTALGLEHAFRRGMVHHDIKPHNLMVDQSGQIRILDFGLARWITQTSTLNVHTDPSARGTAWRSETTAEPHLGTADYMAPELMLDQGRADIRSDIYSLGCTLHRLLTGRVPCSGDTLADRLDCHRAVRFPSFTGPWVDLPVRLQEVIQQMLAFEADERFQTPLEVAEAMKPFMAEATRRILIVDDDSTTRWALKRLLSEQGHETFVAANGREALQVLSQNDQIGLILMDLEMPIMDGWGLLRALKQDPATADIPVIIISSNAPLGDVAANVGAAASLRKPIHVNRLLSILNTSTAASSQ